MADANALPPRQHSEALWRPRPPVQLEKAVGQYSRFVGRMKIALPVIAGVILLLVLILPQLRSESERFRLGLKKITDIAGESASMVNARYFGTDNKGQPFQVIVGKAQKRDKPNADGANLVDLTQPHAEFSAGDGARVKVSATDGVYNQTDETLDLGGEVALSHDQGIEMRTSSARVRLKDSVVTGDQPVTVKGDSVEIKAAGFSARQNDNVLIFTGPGTLTLKSKNGNDQGAKPGEKQP